MLGIVLINYKSESELLQYISNELSKTTTEHKIVVVDNSYKAKSHDRLKAQLENLKDRTYNEDVFLITKKENLGYAKANNFGARFLREKFDIHYFLFSNTDIEFKDDDLVEGLIQHLNEIPEKYAAIGPRVIGLNGNDQSPHPKISFARYAGWKLLPFLRRKKKMKVDEDTEIAEGPCYWVSGCFMLIRTEDFMDAGCFDEHTFLYGEEMILAERLKKIKRSMYFYPKKKIIHHEGRITLKNHKTNEVLKIAQKSQKYYYQTYIGIPKFILNLINRI